MMSAVAKALKLIKDEEIEYVDVRFTDPKGKLQHVTLVSDLVDEDFFEEGFMFDGSSIAGWKSIDQSDMKLMPDAASAPTSTRSMPKRPSACIATWSSPTPARPIPRPRQTALKAEAYLKILRHRRHRLFRARSRILHLRRRALFGDAEQGFVPARRRDAAWNTDSEYEGGNLAHRAGYKGGYFPGEPDRRGPGHPRRDAVDDEAHGHPVDKHHHEVATCQHELGMIFGGLVEQADNIQKYKYVIHNVAAAYGKTVTFMPKPMKGDNGSGMHVNMSIWKGGKPLFAGDKYADLSQEALWFIGGILKHAKALNALTNPATNSYKRLIPGFEAPVLRAYSARNRSGCVRIPWTESPKAKRVEARFPDPAANPYLAFAALMMAGLDGIKNKIDPGPASDKDLYDLPPEELAQIPTVCGSLREALEELEKDMDFLLAGDVFTRDQLESYMALKWEEVYAFEHTPHPIEYQMYYSC
jgi:glutamine synthetase